jgi:RNA polymerase sigma-70 factor (ECF subfamily)
MKVGLLDLDCILPELGGSGLMRYVNGKIESVHAFIEDDARIVSVFVIRNPDKLAAIPLFS